jgi:DNA-binding NarL/FixJ family response regulator
MMLSTKHTVVLADDHVVLRQGLRSLLEKDGEFEVVAEANDGFEAVRFAGELMPEILIIDLSMPRLTGMDAIRELRKLHSNIRIIVLTVHSAEEYVYESFKAGADGYVLKAADYGELVAALRTVMRGKLYLSPDISNTVVTGYLKTGGEKTLLRGASAKGLTPREREVLKLVAEGRKNREIADMLEVSVKTVEKHRENIREKLDLHSTSAMIACAIENGLLSR